MPSGDKVREYFDLRLEKGVSSCIERRVSRVAMWGKLPYPNSCHCQSFNRAAPCSCVIEGKPMRSVPASPALAILVFVLHH